MVQIKRRLIKKKREKETVVPTQDKPVPLLAWGGAAKRNRRPVGFFAFAEQLGVARISRLNGSTSASSDLRCEALRCKR